MYEKNPNWWVMLGKYLAFLKKNFVKLIPPKFRDFNFFVKSFSRKIFISPLPVHDVTLGPTWLYHSVQRETDVLLVLAESKIIRKVSLG